MCPRETHKQPKADMSDEVFERLVSQAGETAEHMMLIGLGEPFPRPAYFSTDRVLPSPQHLGAALHERDVSR